MPACGSLAEPHLSSSLNAGALDQLGCELVTVDILFKVTQARAHCGTLLKAVGDRIGGLETIAGDAGHGKLIGLDPPVRVEAGSNGGGDATGSLGEDALRLGELTNSGDYFKVGNILCPAAARKNGTRRVDPVSRIAKKRTGLSSTKPRVTSS